MDNIKIIRIKNIKVISGIKIKLISTFKIVNIRLISFYLGLKINKNCKKKIIKLSQLAYIQNFFIIYYLNKANLTKILIKKILLRLNHSIKAI